MRKKQYRELTERMGKNELLCHQIIGRLAALNKRLDELNNRLDELSNRHDVEEHALKLVMESMGTVLERLNSLDTDGTNNGAWMQDGIDSILGYQWPPKRGEGK